MREPNPMLKANDGGTRRYGIVTDENLSCSVVAGLATCSGGDRVTACPRDPVQRTRRDHLVGDSGRWRPSTGPVPCFGLSAIGPPGMRQPRLPATQLAAREHDCLCLVGSAVGCCLEAANRMPCEGGLFVSE
jgi:hypothetical protein